MRKLALISLLVGIFIPIQVMTNVAHAETKCPDTWGDPRLNLQITPTNFKDKDGLAAQTWAYKLTSTFDVEAKLKNYGLTSKDYVYKAVMEVANDSKLTNPKPFEWYVPNGYESSLMRGMDGGNPQIGEGTYIWYRINVAVKDCPKEVIFSSNNAQFTGFLEDTVPLNKLFATTKFNFQQENYITENLQKTKNQLQNLTIRMEPNQFPYLFNVDWIYNMRNVVNGGPSLLVSGYKPVGCVEPFGSTSGPPVDPKAFKFNSFPCEIGIHLQSGYYWKLVDKFVVNPVIVSPSATPSPTPNPSKSAVSQAAQNISLEAKLITLQNQINYLQSQIKKICSVKPKPKFC